MKRENKQKFNCVYRSWLVLLLISFPCFELFSLKNGNWKGGGGAEDWKRNIIVLVIEFLCVGFYLLIFELEKYDYSNFILLYCGLKPQNMILNNKVMLLCMSILYKNVLYICICKVYTIHRFYLFLTAWVCFNQLHLFPLSFSSFYQHVLVDEKQDGVKLTDWKL